jgi:hypothetical protein
MNPNISKRLIELKKHINKSKLQNDILPDVTQRIQEMLEIGEQKGFNHEDVKRLARGLGLFISHDYTFTESATGKKILDTVDLIIESG